MKSDRNRCARAWRGGHRRLVFRLQTRDSLIHFGAKSLLPAVTFYSVRQGKRTGDHGFGSGGRWGRVIGAGTGIRSRHRANRCQWKLQLSDPYRYLVATRVLGVHSHAAAAHTVRDFCAIMMGWIAETVADPITFATRGNATKGVQFRDFISTHAENARLRIHHRDRCLLQGMRTTGGTAGWDARLPAQWYFPHCSSFSPT